MRKLSEFLDEELGPSTLGDFLAGTRRLEQATQENFAKKLGISRARLCDIEKGRRTVSVDMAVKFAKALRMPAESLVALVLQETVDKANVKLRVVVKAA